MVLAEGGISIKEYYGMPDGEIPFNVYEDKKVRELSERIISHEGSGKASNVHIIAGRKPEQVRRIAYLTAQKLIKAGSEVIPLKNMDSLDENGITQGKYPVFLLDEGQVRDNLPEGEAFDPDKVSQVMRFVRKNYARNHAIFLSLSQETYEARFRDTVEGGTELERPSREERKERKENVTDNQKGSRYWYAFLLPALSFLVSPVSQYFQFSGNPFKLGSIVFAAFQNVIYPVLFVAPVIFSVAGIVALVYLGRQEEGKSRRILNSGLTLFLAEIAIPLMLYAVGLIPLGNQPRHSIIGYYTFPLVLFVLFQSIAAISFLMIPLSYSNRSQGAAIAISFILSEAFLAGIYLSVSSYISPNLTYAGSAILGRMIGPFPMVAPFNTIFFGLDYGPSFIIGKDLHYLAYLAQLLFGLSYLYVAVGQKRMAHSMKWNDDSPDARSA